MAGIVMSDDLGAKIVKILGMPKYTKEFSMNLKAGDVAIVECKFILENNFDQNEIINELAKYKIVKIDDKPADRRKKRRMDSED